MKLPLLILFCFATLHMTAQPQYHYSFEPPYDKTDWFLFDTTHHNNSWQIGKPQKNIFDSASTYPNAIMTDTLTSYPVADTSVFYLKIISYYNSLTSNAWFVWAGISFRYQLDIDSGETGKVEILADSGRWIDLSSEDTTYGIIWSQGKPDLTKPTTGWEIYNASFIQWAMNSGYPYQITKDTTYLRFTFISDSVQTNRDGWIIDDIWVHNFAESVETITNNNLISIYPNPASDYIYIKANYNYYAKPEIVIYNLQGQQVYAPKELPQNGYLHVNLPAGMYTLVYSTGSERAIKQLVIRK